MPFHFYISYARVDSDGYLQKFFEDLTYAIQIRLGFPRDTEVGFFGQREFDPQSQWPDDSIEALRTSRTMVSILSPAYFSSEYAGKEWQLFETRSHLGNGRTGSSESWRPNPPSLIAPVIWVPWQDCAPKVVNEIESRIGESSSIYKRNGLLTMRKALSQFQREYVELVVALAEQIIERSATTKSPLLDVLPKLDELDSAFSLFDESSFDEPKEKSRYKVVVIEDHDQVREMLVEGLRVFGHEAKGFAQAEPMLREILPDDRQVNMPDLFIIDLQLEPEKIQGMDLIERLTTNKVPSAIIAMSASLSSSNYYEARGKGAADVIAKPFDIVRTIRRIETVANIGRNRRLRRQEQWASTLTDPSRRDRPVFLSYAGEDTRTASLVRSHIEAAGYGVWYSSQLEGSSRERILNAIDQAHVFVPLITINYPSSYLCLAEMVRFYHRRRNDKSPLLVPVLDGLLSRIRNLDLIKPIIEEHPYVDITAERLVEGLNALLGLIQKTVGRQPEKEPESRE